MIAMYPKTVRTLLPLFLLAALPVSAAAQTVGDANGDGRFAIDDLLLVKQAIEAGLVEVGVGGLTDVAEPCDGVLDAADLSLLTKALQVADLEVTVPSPCHGEDLGAPLPAPAPTTPVTLDDVFAEIAQEVPEFGGLYLDGGQAMVVLTNVGALADAEAAVFARFDYERLGTDMLTPVEGDYGFLDLLAWRIAARDVVSLPGVNALDIDEERNRIWVGLTDVRVKSDAEAFLDRAGVRLEAVEFGEIEKISFNAPPDYQAQWRPMRAGILVARPLGGGMFSGCTMGPIVERNGKRGWLTNAHCTPTIGAVDGVSYTQPVSTAAADFAGLETVDPPLFGNAQQSSCPSGQSCRWSDSAFMEASFVGTTRLGRILTDTPAWNSRRVVGKELFPLKGDPISKSGQATGQTAGHVDKTCMLIEPSGEVTFTMLCQNRADYDAFDGDSGSPVYRNEYPDEAILYGIHWGRMDINPGPEYSMFSGIANIEADLGFLDVHWGEGHPQVEFITPLQGDDLGPGSFFQFPLSVSVGDHEDGVLCSGCWVDWTSNVDGYLDGAPVINGIADGTAVISGPGNRAIWAHAMDTAGAWGHELVVVTTSDTAPNVWIESPADGAELTVGIGTLVAGNSFDVDTWMPLPCSSLVWSTSVPADGIWQGCSPIVQFSTPGPRTLYLTGTDTGGLSDVDSIQISVVGGPSTGPPQVTILDPNYNAFLPRTLAVTLGGKAVDPDGKSPINYQWIIHGPNIFGGGPAVIGTASGNNGQTISMSWTPANHVAITCGGVPLQLELRAVDADGEQGSAFMPIYIGDPPC